MVVAIMNKCSATLRYILFYFHLNRVEWTENVTFFCSYYLTYVDWKKQLSSPSKSGVQCCEN